MRHMSALAAVLLFASSVSAESWRNFRTGRSSRGKVYRQAGQAEAPAPQAGALIRTAGAGWKVAPGSPARHHFVDGGGFIAGGGHYLSLHPGVQTVSSDRPPTTTLGATASGRNAITPNANTSSSGDGGSNGPPFPGGASGQAPHNK